MKDARGNRCIYAPEPLGQVRSGSVFGGRTQPFGQKERIYDFWVQLRTWVAIGFLFGFSINVM